MNISLDVEVLVKNGTLVLTDRDGKAITFSPGAIGPKEGQHDHSGRTLRPP